jgi:hypothetical protein
MRDLKFLGGTETFPQEKLQKAARTASEIVARVLGPDASSEDQETALAGFLDMLGLVPDDDPRHARLAGAIGDLTQRE